MQLDAGGEPKKRHGPGKPMRVDCKSERIVRLRLEGKPWGEIAAAVGSTSGSCRVLFYKRRRRTSQFLAGDASANAARESGRWPAGQ